MFFEETMIAMILDDPCVVMSHELPNGSSSHDGSSGSATHLGILRWANSSAVADLQSVADLHAAPFFANSMMVEFAGDQVLKFYNSHLLELTWTCSGED